MSEQRGRYIVWEGSDGVGKTTNILRAVAESEKRGIQTLQVREPGFTRMGKIIRQILLSNESGDIAPETEYALFLADRSHLARSVIEPALINGIDVHSDRNWWSGLGYQSAGGGMKAEMLIEMTKMIMPEWYIKPDIGIVLDIDDEERQRRKIAEAALKGIALDRMESKGDVFFKAVLLTYREVIIGELGGIGVDASGSLDDVAARWMPLLFPEQKRSS